MRKLFRALCTIIVFVVGIGFFVVVVLQYDRWQEYVLSLPLYFHVLLLMNLGLWCWTTNLHILNLAGIDTWMLLESRHAVSGSSDGTPTRHEKTPDELESLSPSPARRYSTQRHMGTVYSLYKLSIMFTAITCVSLGLFAYFSEAFGEEQVEAIPTWTYTIIFLLAANPFSVFYYSERRKFIGCLSRSALGGLHSAVSFSDVLLGDILTSFSQVMGDLQFVFRDLALPPDAWAHPQSDDGHHQQSVSALVNALKSVLVSLPYLFRMRQCLAECNLSNESAARKRHLANALKYLSAFPVIYTSYLINTSRSSTPIDSLVSYWAVFSAINSLYSLYWDIVMDWHLGGRTKFVSKQLSSDDNLDKPVADESRGFTFLRPYLHFRYPFIYYTAIVIDTIIRHSWVVRITLVYKMPAESPPINLIAIDLGFKVIEIARRWMWVFFRIEREWTETVL